MDPGGDYAYVATSTSPLRILKVDLASFQVVDRVTLAEGENGVVAGVIDPEGRYAYVATLTRPPRVVKVDLDALTRVGAIAFEGNLEWSNAGAVMDPAGRHAYFAGRDRRLMRIDLDDFSWDPDEGVLELSWGGTSGPHTAVIDPDGSHAYFPMQQGTGEPVLVKVDLGAFEEVGTLALPAASGMSPINGQAASSAVAPDGSHAYFSHYNAPTRISKVDLDAFALVDALELEAFEFHAAATLVSPDGAYAYLGVGPFSTANSVVKVDLDAFERLGVLRMPNNTERNFKSGAIAPDGSRAYFGASTNPGRLVEIALGAAPGDPPERLFGGDRYQTAAEVALARFDAPEVVYLATGANYPDALAGAPLAAREQAPILLTRAQSLPSDTASALGELRPGQVIALGGTAAVSDEVLAIAAQQAGGADTDRLSGPDRYATATEAAGLLGEPDTVYVATGVNFPDALAGGPAAVSDGAPILLTRRDDVPQATLDYLDGLDSLGRVVILGGTAAVSQEVAVELDAMTTGD